MDEKNTKKILIVPFIAILLSSCAYHGSLKKDFYQATQFQSDKIPLTVAIDDKGRHIDKIRTSGALGDSYEIELEDGLVSATQIALENIFEKAVISTHHGKTNDIDFIVDPSIRVNLISTDFWSGTQTFDSQLCFVFRDCDNNEVIAKYCDQQRIVASPTAATTALSFLTGLSLFTLSPITIPAAVRIEGNHGLALVEEHLTKSINIISDDIIYDKRKLMLASSRTKMEPPLEIDYKQKKQQEPRLEKKTVKIPSSKLALKTIDKAPQRNLKCKDGYAIVVGIEKYRDLPEVEFAQRDAQVLREYLIKSMGFPESNIVTLLNERALKTDLAKYFESWLKNNVDKDSSVFIYYSGHGAPGLKGDKAYLVPYDGDPNYPETTCYPLDSLYASLNKLPAKQIIVAMDSCFSGAGGRSVVGKGARPLVHISVENPMLASGNTVVLTAAAENQIASFYPEAKHGLFTYFFLRGLRGDGDLDGDGWVELKELFDYLKPEVIGIARRMNREQTPVILPSLEVLGKRGEYRLTKAK